MCVCIYICAFFAVSVACTLEQVFWAPVHVQLYVLYRCSFVINIHICNTFAAGCAHMCICIYTHYTCICYACVCVSTTLFDMLSHSCWDFLSVHRCVNTCICICVCMYACICACSYVCICMYVCLCIYMHIHVYTRACGCTYAHVYAHFIYLYSPIPLLHACVSQVFFKFLHAWVGGDWKWGFFPACSWLVLVPGVGGYVLAGVETGGLSCIFL